MGRAVLDASALLAFLFKEPGADRVRALLSECAMSDVNRSEVIAAALKRGATLEGTTTMLAHLPIEWIPFGPEDAVLAASLSQPTSDVALSVGDLSCLALGKRLGLPVITADGEWTRLGIDVEVQAIR